MDTEANWFLTKTNEGSPLLCFVAADQLGVRQSCLLSWPPLSFRAGREDLRGSWDGKAVFGAEGMRIETCWGLPWS